MQAAYRLPVDYDELTYLPAAYRYAEMLRSARWMEVMNYQEVMEHPAMNKLLFAVDIALRHPKEPNWDALQIGKPIPQPDVAAFIGARLISAVGGTLQVFLTSLIQPFGGVLLALNTYHIKYSAQAYLEGIPGFMAVLAVVLLQWSVAKGDAGTKRQTALLAASSIALGLAAAGKYLYGIVGFVLIWFLIQRKHSWRAALIYAGTALLVFFVTDPYLWPNPAIRLWNSLTYHWHFAHGEHVASSGLPWYAALSYLLYSRPMHWHPGVFYTGIADLVLLPLACIGIYRTAKEQPVWLALACVGLIFLFLWATKWPQYTLLILPPVCVCAGFGVQQIVAAVSAKLHRNRNTV